MNPYIYKIYILDELDRTHDYKEAGIVYGENYSHAVSRIESYYGSNNIIEISSLVAMEDSPIIISEQAYKEIMEDTL